MSLADQACKPCRKGTPPLDRDQSESLLRQLGKGWGIKANGRLEKTYTFENFIEAMSFANRITPVAEAEGHHPDLHVSWGKCVVEIWTHAIQGLSKNDFYLAAKIDRSCA